jgi:hypothetical protein
MPDLTVKPLDEQELGLAYPLVLRAARIGQDRWAAFARELLGAGGGIIGAMSEDNQLLGVAAYRRLGSLRHESTLQIDVIVAFELSRLAPVRKSLCAALERIACDQDCASLSYTMAATGSCEAGSERRRGWEKLGLSMETVSFVRQLRGSAPGQMMK